MIGKADEPDPAEDALLNNEVMNNPLGVTEQLATGAVDAVQAGVLRMTAGGDYILDEGSCWIMVGNLSVYVKKETEGVAVDIYPLNDENSDSLAATYALFSEAGEGGAGIDESS